MKPILAYSCVILMTACNPYMDLNKGVVHGGFMSKNQAFAGSITTASGVKAKWSMVGSDSTEVPIAITNAVGTAVTVTQATKGLINRQDNDAAISATRIKANTTPVKSVEGEIVTFPPQQ